LLVDIIINNEPTPFGETPKERSTYLMWAFSGMINVALLHCQSCIQADITPSFYEKVKIELKNN